MLWGIAALTLFGSGTFRNGVPLPIVAGHRMEPIDAMPAMLAQILGPGIKGIVVAGMLAATHVGQQFLSSRLERGDLTGCGDASAAA